jgi:hypothetical protein
MTPPLGRGRDVACTNFLNCLLLQGTKPLLPVLGPVDAPKEEFDAVKALLPEPLCRTSGLAAV